MPSLRLQGEEKRHPQKAHQEEAHVQSVPRVRLQGEDEQRDREAQGLKTQHRRNVEAVRPMRLQDKEEQLPQQAHQEHAHVRVSCEDHDRSASLTLMSRLHSLSRRNPRRMELTL